MMHRIIRDWPGKSAIDGGPAHPAVYHMLDVAAVAERLLEPLHLAPARRDAIVLLTALHDLGKIGAEFRRMITSGARQTQGRHWEVTEIWLTCHDGLLADRLGGRATWRSRLYAAVAGHHGRPPRRDSGDFQRTCAVSGNAEALTDAGQVIGAFLDLWPNANLDDLTLAEATRLSWWLPGLVAAADWVGSNAAWFPPTAAGPSPEDYLERARGLARDAVHHAGLEAASPSGGDLFSLALRPMQLACAEIALPPGPMLAVIEDETGSGKTEAALILAHRMLQAGKGRGLFLALPTTATADAMFVRARDVIGRVFASPPSLALAHGRAAVSGAFRDLVGRARRADGSEGPGDVVCSEWLADGRRRALLATVGVGTIDQALLSVLPTRFSTLRHYGLSSKILIVDEVHEMGEPYLAAELAHLLRAHREAGGSAILLTATLPLAQRASLLAAYGAEPNDDPAYPALTVAGGASRRDLPRTTGPRGPVEVRRISVAADAFTLLQESAAQGAACVWVRNAVDDAIDAVIELRARGIAAELLHARFALCDRLRHEGAALARFGKDGTGRAGRVLVATQVVESSLDLDFDVMVSDLAPMASLIQRAGRLWRHMDRRPLAARPVPAPVLHVLAPDPAGVADAQWLHRVLDRGAFVYPLDVQWRTADALFRAGEIVAPSGLRALIEAVHGPDAVAVPAVLDAAERQRIGEGFAAANQARHNLIKLEEGYRQGAQAADDIDYPTRLGQPQRTLLLVRTGPEGPMPWAVDSCQPGDPAAWQMSEVRVAERRVSTLDLPDQEAPSIAALTADWPEWRRRAVTVCPVGQGGDICDGLRYDPELGIVSEEGQK